MIVRKVLVWIGAATCLICVNLVRAQPASSGASPAAISTPSSAIAKREARRQDRALARSVRNALRKVQGIDVANIQVASRSGVVTIIGNVRDQGQIDASSAAAAKVAGVSRVDNRLTVTEPSH